MPNDVDRVSRGQRSDGRSKRIQILDAAVRVFGMQGPGAFTHRAVATLAGVPLGSTTYYFRDSEELLEQTMLHAVEMERNRLQAVGESAQKPQTAEEAVDLLTSMFMSKVITDPIHELALFEMFILAARRPSVRQETSAWSELIAGLIDDVLPPTAPHLSRETAVQIVAAAIDGLMLEELSNHSLGLKRMRDMLLHIVRPLCA